MRLLCLPGPFIVAVLGVTVGLNIDIDPEVPQVENKLPELAVSDIQSDPAFSQTFVPDGLVVPLPEGLTAKVTLY